MNRLRLILIVCLIVLSVPTAVVVESVVLSADAGQDDVPALAAAIPSAAHAVSARPVRDELTNASPIGAGSCLVAIAIFSGLVGPTRRRIGDVGDRWRRLLLGAPPAVA